MDASQLDLLDYVNRYTTVKKVATTYGGEWAGPCPFCGGHDRFRVWPTPDDGRNPNWFCRQCEASGDVIELVMKKENLKFGETITYLGLTHEDKPQTTKRSYRNMQDYAVAHGLDAEDLQHAGWQEIEKEGRPALQFQTKGGLRWRFLDGNEPRYKSEYGFRAAWYGLDDKVLDNARKERAPLVICNGEISTLAARYWNVPAICMAGGGEHKIPDPLLKELLDKWDGRIAIAMDCDTTGRKAAADIAGQLGDKAGIIDLGLHDGQDLADFAKLHGAGSLKMLKRLMPRPRQAPMTHREAALLTRDRLDIHNTIDGKPIVIPYLTWHQFGGYAKIGWPGKLTCGVAMSGHGKTSWLNTGIDLLLKRGDNGVGLMPEYEADEYHWDRLQRYSGHSQGEPLITAELMMEWELWKKEHELGVPLQNRMGRALTADERRMVEIVGDEVESWPGTFELFPLDGSLEDVLQRMGDSITDRRAHGELVTFAAFDYVQILKARGDDDNDNSFEYVLGLIKHFCMMHKIHGLVTSQVTKVADKAARDKNQLLETTDMRYVRDDKINLLVTLNVLYDETGQKSVIGGTPYYAGVANLAKNNKGRTGQVNMLCDFVHLRWLDQQWHSSQLDPNIDDERMERNRQNGRSADSWMNDF